MAKLAATGFILAMLGACSPAVRPGPARHVPAFLVFRSRPAALVELSGERIVHETPVAIPTGCELDAVYPSPAGPTLAIEYECSFGRSVVWLDFETGAARQPVTDSDSHFMAWAPDGQAAYLKVDSMNRPHIVRAPLQGQPANVPITELTYDLAPKPGMSGDFLFSFSRGMGLGSEMWHARSGGQVVEQVLADKRSYISFVRWSPDGRQMAFIKIPDTATPFSVGELWVAATDGSNARKLADVDAGHGFAEAWSPDGSQIAFVVRENPNNAPANEDASALESNIAIVSFRDGSEKRVTRFPHARVEAPVWSPDGKSLAFTSTVDDKMNVYTADLISGQVGQILEAPACCPVWINK